MALENLKNNEHVEGGSPDDFNIPPFLRSLDGLSAIEKAAVLREFNSIAEAAKGKRERFSAQFSDKEGWDKAFKDDLIEFDPDSFYV